MAESWAIIWDLETGGLYHTQGHPIIQFAGAAVDTNFNVLDQLELKIKFDENKCVPIALEKNGYNANKQLWANALEEKVAMQQIANFFRRHARANCWNGKSFKGAVNMGHNATAFDRPFIDAAMERHGVFFPADRTLDTLQYAFWYFHHRPSIKRPAKLNQAAIAKYFGIEYDAHKADADVACLAKIMQCFKFGGKKYAEVQKLFQQPTLMGAAA